MKYEANEYWEQRLRDRFDLSGVGYLGFDNHYNKWLYKAKLRALQKSFATIGLKDCTNKAIIDIGCGTGFFINHYDSVGAEKILGVDITMKSVEENKKRFPKYEFIRQDIGNEEMPINVQFDIVSVFDVLYHIVDDSRFVIAINNISKLCKREGFIFITDYFGERDIKVASHVKFRSLSTYFSVISQNNLKLVKIVPMYFFLNRSIFNKIQFFSRIGNIDSYLAPIYYFFDSFLLPEGFSNLRLAIYKRQK